ncbi:MAG: ATP-binding protein, partial [Campylobacterota bacterium]
EGVIIFVNQSISQMMGYAQEELLHTKIDTYSPHSAKNIPTLQLLRQKMQSYEVFKGDIEVQRKDGTVYVEHNIIAPVSVDGVIQNFIGIKQKLTRELQLKNELAQKEEMLIAQSRHAAMGEMVGMIAHQWRQPISVISMGVNNILADLELGDIESQETRQNLQDILKQTSHLSQTIDDFRNFFKPDKQKRYILVHDAIGEAMAIMGKSLENNGIEVQLRLHAQQEIKTYDRELLQVLINIIKNAKEAIALSGVKTGKISIESTDKDAHVVLQICDNGGGIDPEILDKVFDPYFSTKQQQNGTGLGLYMSKTIVNKHLGGEISAKNYKGGACFELVLPIEYEGEEIE